MKTFICPPCATTNYDILLDEHMSRLGREKLVLSRIEAFHGITAFKLWLRSPRRMMDEAIRYFGSEWKLAEAIKTTQHAVWYAKTHGRVNPVMANSIHAATNGKIRREELCPEIFGPPTIRPLRAKRGPRSRP